jgi:muramoyltetrapeptide carboxypeptidase LdcA involved in peptidoglycan recycling
MPSPIVPPALKPGATIAFISPSARLNDELPLVMQRATSVLESLGYKVRTYFNPDAGIQSSISNRVAEIRAALTAPDVSAVICTIGGPAFTELIPALVADTDLHAAIRANPKIVVGYSDISGLHWLLHAATGLRTFYGPGAIPELGEASSLSDESSPLAFCVKHLFRAIADTRPLGDIARSPTYAKDAAPMFTDPS